MTYVQCDILNYDYCKEKLTVVDLDLTERYNISCRSSDNHRPHGPYWVDGDVEDPRGIVAGLCIEKVFRAGDCLLSVN